MIGIIAFLIAAMLVSAALTWLLDRTWPNMAPAPLAFLAGLVLPICLCVWTIWIIPPPHQGSDEIAPLGILGPIVAMFLVAFTVPAAMATIGWLRRPPSDNAPR